MTDHLQAESHAGISFERRDLQLGARVVEVAVADTPARWRHGMVGQNDVDFMLFVMPADSTFAFHMRHIDRDLAIAVFDGNGDLSDIGLMEAQTGYFRPRRPYKYALEFAFDLQDFSIFRELADGLRAGG